MLIRRYEFQIYADYYQFYLADESSPFETEDIWTDKTVEQMLAVSKKLVAVGTARYETILVFVEFHNWEPLSELEKYSRVNECSLEVTSNKLVLENCTGYSPNAPRIDVEAANYRVRVLYGNLETVKDDWTGEDFYVLQLWKDAAMRNIAVLKS